MTVTTSSHHRTSPVQAARSSTRQGPPGGRLTLGGVVDSEWLKARSLRSTWYIAAGLVGAVVGIGTINAVGAVLGQANPQAPADPLAGALTGIGLAQLLAAALGILAVTGEYATGTIRPSLSAVPRRPALVVAKALVAGALTLGAAVAAVAASFTLAHMIADRDALAANATEPTVLRALAGAAVYLCLTAVVGAACGWLLRSTMGATALVVAILYVPGLLALVVPGGDAAAPYLPANAGSALLQLGPTTLLSPLAGLAVLSGYSAGISALAAVRLNRSDV
ncbi:MAG: hypothetical protein R2761_02425 [Acidimicrobiales bacterium]